MEATLAGLVLDGKYRLTVPLGEGGMGVVYAAQHVLLGKPLAVKLLKPRLVSEPVALARFQQEAVQVSRIGSPHIVQVLDLGSAPDGSPFMVMELLEGETLYARLMENPAQGTNEVIPPPSAADIVSQILSGLEAAHARGIVHRDLKPGNVFLTRVGDRTDFVKLLDFGLSKVLGGDRIAHMTRTGVLLGTPTYMAPEQVLARKDVDHRADLWAAGVVLFRMLVGRRPHEGRSAAERMAAITTVDAPPLRHFRPDLDPGLEAVVRKALARSPGERFQSAGEFRAALAPWAPAPHAAVPQAAIPGGGTPLGAASAPPGPWTATPLPRTTPAVPPTVVAVAPTVVSVPPTVVSVPPTVVLVPPTVVAVAPTVVSVPPTVTTAAAATERGTVPSPRPAVAPVAPSPSRSRLLLWLGMPSALVVVAAGVLLLVRPWESSQAESAAGPGPDGVAPSEQAPGGAPPAGSTSDGTAAGSPEVGPDGSAAALPATTGTRGASESKTILTISVPRPGTPDALPPPPRNAVVPPVGSGSGDTGRPGGEDEDEAPGPEAGSASVRAAPDAGGDARRNVEASMPPSPADAATAGPRPRMPSPQPAGTGGGVEEPAPPRNDTSYPPADPVGEEPPEEDPWATGGNRVGPFVDG